MHKSDLFYTRILAVFAAGLILLSQVLWFLPALSFAETAGDVLVVRVQYFGESGDKIREKARFTRSELESMGSGTYYYSNITRVGTVMSMAAYGPEVMTIIENAGIDPGSIQNVTFRTTDGYTRNFTVERHLTAEKYYYPYLNSLYERNEEGNALTPLEGALEDKTPVPAILALEFGESKKPGLFAEDLEMSTERTYRFCMGQADLTEGVMTNPDDSAGDITSMESCHSIYGIDVTLAGSPIYGMSLDLDDTSVKVGSVKRIEVSFDVDEAFEGAFTAEDLIWSSSDESIATVNSKGEVTITGKGEVTITATAPDGTSASVTINGTEEEQVSEPEDEKSQGSSDKDADRDKKPKVKKDKEEKKSRQIKKKTTPEPSQEKTETPADKAADEPEKKTSEKKQPDTKAEQKEVKKVLVRAHEIQIGNMVTEEVSPQEEMRESMSDDASALDAARTYDPAAAAGTAAGAGALCGAGAVARVIRYRRDFH